MSSDRVEVVRAAFARWNAGDRTLGGRISHFTTLMSHDAARRAAGLA